MQGLIAFFFACYGAGAPKDDEFAIRTWQEAGVQVGGLEQVMRIPIAPESFIARLPQRLLGHPRGGALAVVGHVDRAWGASFIWEGARQATTFDSALQRLFAGERLGAAMEDFNVRYAELSTEVADRIEQLKGGEVVRPEELARLWTANSDARNYVILGDPAVRLAVTNAPAAAGHVRREPAILAAATAPAATGQASVTLTTYHNFDLLLTRSGARYKATVVDAPAGEGPVGLRPAQGASMTAATVPVILPAFANNRARYLRYLAAEEQRR
jgi:hypothetical protein